jgi:uncharacterized protein YqgV (UPF0045/DUF77 family)
MSDPIAEQIEADVKRLEERFNSTSNIRKTIIDKLSGVVAEMDINPNQDKSTMLDAKMNVVNTLLKAVNDDEYQRISTIKLKQTIKRDKDVENQLASISNTVAEFIKQIKPNINTMEIPKSDKSSPDNDLLDKSVEEADFDIQQGELEITTETAKDIDLK